MREQGEAFLQKVWAVELPESDYDLDGVSNALWVTPLVIINKPSFINRLH